MPLILNLRHSVSEEYSKISRENNQFMAVSRSTWDSRTNYRSPLCSTCSFIRHAWRSLLPKTSWSFLETDTYWSQEFDFRRRSLKVYLDCLLENIQSGRSIQACQAMKLCRNIALRLSHQDVKAFTPRWLTGYLVPITRIALLFQMEDDIFARAFAIAFSNVFIS